MNQVVLVLSSFHMQARQGSREVTWPRLIQLVSGRAEGWAQTDEFQSWSPKSGSAEVSSGQPCVPKGDLRTGMGFALNNLEAYVEKVIAFQISSRISD